MRRKITDNELKEMERLYKQGLGCVKIGKILGRNSTTVYNTLILRTSHHFPFRFATTDYRPITKEELGKYISLRQQGWSYNKIAKLFGRKTFVVYNKLKKNFKN